MNIAINTPKSIKSEIIKNTPRQVKSKIVQHNRIGNRIISKELISVKGFNINGAMHSIDVKQEYFTNYVKSYDKKIYREVKEIFDEIHFQRATLDDKFQLLNNEKENELAKKRLNEIIKDSLNINKIPELMKFKPKHKKEDKTLEGVRIYVYYDKNIEEFDLYLVDLYHLGIDGFNTNIGKYDLKHRYEINSNCNKCISKLTDAWYDAQEN